MGVQLFKKGYYCHVNCYREGRGSLGWLHYILYLERGWGSKRWPFLSQLDQGRLHPYEIWRIGNQGLTMFDRVLRLQWPWYAWEFGRCWSSMEGHADPMWWKRYATFRSMYKNLQWAIGKTAKFWRYPWLNGPAPAEIAPLLFLLARGKNILVFDALNNGRWLAFLSSPKNMSCTNSSDFGLELKRFSY